MSKTTAPVDKTKSSHTSVQILLGEHWLFGSINTQSRRVLDLLREPHTCFIHVENAVLTSRTDLGTTRGSFQSAYLPKEKISLMVLPKRDEQDPLQKMFRISESRSFQGAVVLPHCEVEGDVHGTPRLADSAGTYIPEMQTFFPITKARLSMLNQPAIHAPTMIVNKTAVIAFLSGQLPSAPEEFMEPIFDLRQRHVTVP